MTGTEIEQGFQIQNFCLLIFLNKATIVANFLMRKIMKIVTEFPIL